MKQWARLTGSGTNGEMMDALVTWVESKIFSTDPAADALAQAATFRAEGKLKEAMTIYLEQSDKRVVFAQDQIKSMIKDAQYNRSAKEEIFQACNEASGCNSRTAPFYLGFMYSYGYGVSKDTFTAIGAFQKATENGVGDAPYYAAGLYERGDKKIGFAPDYTTALAQYKQADKNGVPKAAYKIGRIYDSGGYGVDPNNKAAIAYYKKALQHGVLSAATKILVMYQNGRVTKADLKYVHEQLENTLRQGSARAKEKAEQILKRLDAVQSAAAHRGTINS